MAGTLLAKKAKSSSKDDTSKPDSSFAKLLVSRVCVCVDG